MKIKDITVQNKLGLHARAAMKLIDLADKFTSHVSLTYNNRTIDGKDIMAVLSLGSPQGTQLTLTVEGGDEEQAFTAIEALFNDKFGEAE